MKGPRRKWCMLLNGSLAMFLMSQGACASRTHESQVSVAVELPDSILVLEPDSAYQRALELGRQQQFNKSLPYFRQALATPTTAWQPHCDYAITLFHASFETRVLRGRVTPVARSTYERAQLLVDASRQLDLAERLTAKRDDGAFVIARRARQLAALGFPWDATLEYERAARMDPQYSGMASAQLHKLRNPLEAQTAPP